MGLGGFGVDTLLSLTYVNPLGKLVTVTPRDTDLWWALRGAGPNFGIVTSAVVKSTYVPQANNTAWLGSIIYTEDKLEAVVLAIENLKLEPKMNVFLYYAVSEGKPVILVTPFYYGDEATARQKFASLLKIGPVKDTTAVTPYNHWNDGAAGVCTRGGRKPSYGAGMLHMRLTTWRAVWIEFVKFTSIPGTELSTVLMEAYSLGKGRSVPDSSSAFPYRQVTFNAVAIPWYSDAKLDPVATAYGNKVRDIWWTNDGMTTNTRYVFQLNLELRLCVLLTSCKATSILHMAMKTSMWFMDLTYKSYRLSRRNTTPRMSSATGFLSLRVPRSQPRRQRTNSIGI